MIDTREHILRTAFRLFITKSYKAVTMCDLEKATGLTKGAFYHYFKNKEEIYIEVIDRYFFTSKVPRNEEIEENGTLLQYIEFQIDHLDYLVKKLKEIANIDRPDPTSISLIMEAKEYYPGFMEKHREMNDAIFNRWERAISKAKKRGEIIQDIESDILAENFIGISLSIFRTVLAGRSLEFALSMIKLQFMQLYRLVKK